MAELRKGSGPELQFKTTEELQVEAMLPPDDAGEEGEGGPSSASLGGHFFWNILTLKIQPPSPPPLPGHPLPPVTIKMGLTDTMWCSEVSFFVKISIER